MAINKNFVIKNGVQVSTDLIIGDADNNKVGIGTTIPGYDLHIGIGRNTRGGIGATDLVVTGVGTITNLNVTGLSTFAGALDVNSTVDFAADVVFNGTNDITFDQSESALVLNDGAAIRVGTSSDFSITHDGSNTILRESGTGDLQIYASRIELGGASVDETTAVFTENGAAELWYNNVKQVETIETGFLVGTGVTLQRHGGVSISGITTVNGAAVLGSSIAVAGITSLGGDVDLGNATSDTITATGRFDSDLIPSTDGARDLGSSTLEWQDLFIDGTATIDTLQVDENATITGSLTANGDVDLGNATSDTISFTGRVDTDIVPSTDGARDLGASGLEFKDLFIDGTANIDALIADSAKISDLTSGRVVLAGTSGELEDSGNLTFDGSTLAITGSIDLSADIDVDGTANLDNIDVDGTSNFADDVTLVAAGSSTILFDASGFDLTFQDNIRAKFGTGKDLAIYHDGLNSYIQDTGTGDLNISGSIVRLQSSGGETLLRGVENGAVELYYDNSNKLETTSGGLNITGITTISDRLQVTSGISTFYDTTQSTSATTGAVIINGGVGIAKNVNIGGNLTVTGTTTFNGGTLTLGDANTDNIVFGGEVDSNIIPDDDNTHDLGSSSQQWKDIYIHGVGYIDSISADTAAISDLTSGRVVLAGTSGELEDSGNLTFDGSTLGITGSIDLSADIDVDGVANLDNIDVDGTANFADDVTLVAAGSSTILFDASAHDLIFQDNIRAKFGTGSDLDIHHNGTDSVITNATNDLNIITTGDDINITAADDINLLVQGGENGVAIKGDGEVILYHNANARITTTSDGADFGGTGALGIPKGDGSSDRPSSPAVGDFRYNTDDNQFEGYTDEGWGAIAGSGGGATEVDTSVSTTSATSTGSFAKASFRSASIIAQITQGSAYQVGRYLLIHDGTTVTTIEESAVATGSMLGTFEGVINGSNVEFRVTMGSSSSATVTTKIDTVTV